MDNKSTLALHAAVAYTPVVATFSSHNTLVEVNMWQFNIFLLAPMFH